MNAKTDIVKLLRNDEKYRAYYEYLIPKCSENNNNHIFCVSLTHFF